MNNELNLPELPPRHKWSSINCKPQISAIGTNFLQNTNITSEECVYWLQYGGKVMIWENGKQWVVHSVVEDKQEAVNIMAALCWLKVSDYTFLEETST